LNTFDHLRSGIIVDIDSVLSKLFGKTERLYEKPLSVFHHNLAKTYLFMEKTIASEQKQQKYTI